MALIRRLLRFMRPIRKMQRRGYDDEVLYSGWVKK
jgi:hypothetical protein